MGTQLAGPSRAIRNIRRPHITVDAVGSGASSKTVRSVRKTWFQPQPSQLSRTDAAVPLGRLLHAVAGSPGGLCRGPGCSGPQCSRLGVGDLLSLQRVAVGRLGIVTGASNRLGTSTHPTREEPPTALSG